MAFRRTVVRGGRSSKRESQWLDIAFVATTLTTPGGTITNSASAAVLALRPFTIIRVHMEIFVISDQAAAIEQQAGAYGLAVVSDQALAIGITAVPTPVTDMGSDLWFLHQIYFVNSSSLTDRSMPGQKYSIDSKAMRKVNDDQDIAFVAETSAVAAGAILFTAGRMLVKRG